MNDVLSQMQAKYDASGQRLFWVSEFAGGEVAVRQAVDALEAEGRVKWYLEFQCPECNAEWGGHPSRAPGVCKYCGYNWRKEEDDDFFVTEKFTWNVEAKPSAEAERDSLKARVAELERQKGEHEHEYSMCGLPNGDLCHECVIETCETVAALAEREACVEAAVSAIRHSQQTTDQCRADVAAAIRARGGQ